MKSVFDRYYSLWPEGARERLRPLLTKVPVLELPKDKASLKAVAPRSVVAVVDKLPLRDVMKLVELGFEHVVQSGREDFAQELLASSLMTVKPESFFNNPVPFFLSGFDSHEIVNDPDRHLLMRFTKQREKEMLLDWLGMFLDRDARTSTIRELCLQCADEMISNALFNAPILTSGRRAYKDLPRHTDIALPNKMAASIFACFAEGRVVIGCTDAYGSLTKDVLVNHLSDMFNSGGTDFKFTSGGAGLGVRYMIENAANFYVLVAPGRFTLIAAGFILKGLKSNMTASKHIHFSFG